MNKEATLAAIAVMQAYVDGKTIECQKLHSVDKLWTPCMPPSWDWTGFNYRIKPEPREYWVVTDDMGVLHVLRHAPREDWHEVIHVREIVE